jgi:hypothetical protein
MNEEFLSNCVTPSKGKPVMEQPALDIDSKTAVVIDGTLAMQEPGGTPGIL